ncbi:DoxX family membrane protein [Corynebacterium aquatimens]
MNRRLFGEKTERKPRPRDIYARTGKAAPVEILPSQPAEPGKGTAEQKNAAQRSKQQRLAVQPSCPAPQETQAPRPSNAQRQQPQAEQPQAKPAVKPEVKRTPQPEAPKPSVTPAPRAGAVPAPTPVPKSVPPTPTPAPEKPEAKKPEPTKPAQPQTEVKKATQADVKKPAQAQEASAKPEVKQPTKAEANEPKAKTPEVKQEVKQPEQKKPEQKKPEQKKPEQKKPEVNASAAAKAKVAKTAVDKPESAKAEPSKEQTAKSEPTKEQTAKPKFEPTKAQAAKEEETPRDHDTKSKDADNQQPSVKKLEVKSDAQEEATKNDLGKPKTPAATAAAAAAASRAAQTEEKPAAAEKTETKTVEAKTQVKPAKAAAERTAEAKTDVKKAEPKKVVGARKSVNTASEGAQAEPKTEEIARVEPKKKTVRKEPAQKQAAKTTEVKPEPKKAEVKPEPKQVQAETVEVKPVEVENVKVETAPVEAPTAPKAVVSEVAGDEGVDKQKLVAAPELAPAPAGEAAPVEILPEPEAEPVREVPVVESPGRGTLDFGLLLLRLVLGGTLTALALGAFFGLGNSEGLAGLREAYNGYTMGDVLAVAVPTLQLAAGVFLLIGLVTPVAAAVATIATGFGALHAGAAAGTGLNLFAWDSTVWLSLVLLGLSLAIQFTGPGRYGVDFARGWAKRPLVSSWIGAVVGIAGVVLLWWFGTGVNPFA